MNIIYSDVILVAVAAQITGISDVCSTVCSGADQRKHQSFAPLTFVKGIHRWSVDSPHDSPVTRKMFPFDDVILYHSVSWLVWNLIDIDPVLEYDMFTRFSNSRASIYIVWSKLITVTSLSRVSWNIRSPVVPLTRVQERGKCFHLMTSSCGQVFMSWQTFDICRNNKAISWGQLSRAKLTKW